MKYFLGVDGGGTKTKFLLVDEGFNKLCEYEGTTSYILQVGIDGVRRVMIEGLEYMESKGYSREDIASICVGVPGFGESPSDDILVEKALAEIFSFASLSICNDAEVSWAGALECKPGISVVSGTGSIAFGRDIHGKTFRTGGWGQFMGDEGSAFWIGQRGLMLYAKQKDGRAQKSCLVDLIEKQYSCSHFFGMMEITNTLLREEIAGVSRLVSEAAANGCRQSSDIFKDASYELFLHVKAVVSSLAFDNEILVSYTGGVFNAGDLILEPLKEYLEQLDKNVILKKPSMQPWEGAALYAIKKTDPRLG